MDYQADLAAKLARNLELLEMIDPGPGQTFRLDLFFYAPTKQQAECVRDGLDRFGYPAAVERRGGWFRRTWAVLARTPPTEIGGTFLDELTRQLVALAERCESEFDGWGTEIPG